MPDRSGRPSGKRGAGAVKSGLPSGFLGMPSVGYRSHCPNPGAGAPTSAANTQKITATRRIVHPSKDCSGQDLLYQAAVIKSYETLTQEMARLDRYSDRPITRKGDS